MKSTIIVLIVIALNCSNSVAVERTNALMNEEFVSYETCKSIILGDIGNGQAMCIKNTEGDKRHCVLSRFEINRIIRAECGVSPEPRKQKRKGE